MVPFIIAVDILLIEIGWFSCVSINASTVRISKQAINRLGAEQMRLAETATPPAHEHFRAILISSFVYRHKGQQHNRIGLLESKVVSGAPRRMQRSILQPNHHLSQPRWHEVTLSLDRLDELFERKISAGNGREEWDRAVGAASIAEAPLLKECRDRPFRPTAAAAAVGQIP